MNAIYFRGGRTGDLIRLLDKNVGWQKELYGKTLAGSSAGADTIAKYYYNLDSLAVEEGLGMLPVKVLVHYQSGYNAPNVDWDRAYGELQIYKEDLPILALREGEFRIMEKE